MVVLSVAGDFLTSKRVPADYPRLTAPGFAYGAGTEGFQVVYNCPRVRQQHRIDSLVEAFQAHLAPNGSIGGSRVGAGPEHRGAAGDMRMFAPKFIRARLEGFEKDMKICLRAEKVEGRKTTYAYFPALMSCCGTLEYLTSLYLGRTTPCGERELSRYAERFLPQPQYSRDMIRVLVHALRHPVAHRGIASGVWVDRNPANGGRRLTWKLGTTSQAPALALTTEAGTLKKHSPWKCGFTHRMHVHLGRLWRDIKDSALKTDGLCDVLAKEQAALSRFERVMAHLYPREPNALSTRE